MSAQQFVRRVNLSVANSDESVDLSEFRIVFETANADTESPNNMRCRVFNLRAETVQRILTRDYTRVVLKAGYEGQYGLVFDGTIKQFRTGRENVTDSYLDILAADGDDAFNFTAMNDVVAKGTAQADELDRYAKELAKNGVTLDDDAKAGLIAFGGTVPRIRGKVLWGNARIGLGSLIDTNRATFSIQNGKLTIIPLNGYKPGDVFVLNALTGLVGVPRQTQDGIECRVLLNPKIVIGGRVQLDNRLISQEFQQRQLPGGFNLGVPYNRRTGVDPHSALASVTLDGVYRVFVCEHRGDTRGQDWYTDITALAVDPAGKVAPYGRPA